MKIKNLVNLPIHAPVQISPRRGVLEFYKIQYYLVILWYIYRITRVVSFEKFRKKITFGDFLKNHSFAFKIVNSHCRSWIWLLKLWLFIGHHEQLFVVGSELEPFLVDWPTQKYRQNMASKIVIIYRTSWTAFCGRIWTGAIFGRLTNSKLWAKYGL